METNFLHVFLSDLFVWQFERQFVSTSEEKVLNMHLIGIAKHKEVRASMIPWLLSLNNQFY